MDEALLAEYRASTYLVCLNASQWSSIHIGTALPETLQALVNGRGWGFITAWNPRSIRRADAENAAAQQQLLAAIRASTGFVALYPGIGIGTQGWYEPSLFVIGLGLDALDDVCGAHHQNAYVYGSGCDFAHLRELPA
ncbi:MAG: DUF3293 domain-containing protein [Rhodanobacter sp.]